MKSRRNLLACAVLCSLGLIGCTDHVPPFDPTSPFCGGGGPCPEQERRLRDVGIVPTPLMQPPPILGGHLAASADGRFAVAADPDRDRVWIFDLLGRSLEGSVALNPGDEPGRVIEDGEGRFHVALRRSGEIATVDVSSATILARRSVCAAPRGLAYDARTDTIVVACAGGELVTMPADPSGAVLAAQTLEPDLRDVVIDGDRIYVSRFRSAEVLVVWDGAVVERLSIPASSTTDRRDARVAWRMVGDPNGGVWMLHQTHVSDRIDVEVGGYMGGRGQCGDPVVGTAITHLALGEVRPSQPIGDAALAVDVTVVDSRPTIAIAAGERDFGGVRSPRWDIDLCGFGSFDSIERLPGPFTSVEHTPDGRRLLLRRQPLSLFVVNGEDIGQIDVSAADVTHPGQALFHMRAAFGLACGSCHPEGGEDGHTWTFGDDVRRTQDLRGGVAATRPFHWSGDMPDMLAILNGALVDRMGDRPVTSALGEYAESWMNGVAAIPPPHRDPEAVARGGAVFEDVGCASCHSGAQHTDNTNVDVGRGEALQVPRLIGLAARGPYFHDGCAATLDTLLSGVCTPGEVHDLRARSASDRADLVTYLESL